MTEEGLTLWAIVTDPHAVAAVIGANAVAVAVSVLIAAGAYPQPISRALLIFGGGKLLTALGFALIALRTELTPIWSVVAGGGLALAGFSCNLPALQVLQGRPARWGFPLLLTAATVAGCAFFTFVVPDLRGVRLTTSLAAILVCTVLAVELLVRYRGTGRAHLLGGGLAALMVLVMGARVVSAAAGGPQNLDALAAGWSEKIFFIITYIAATMSSLNFVLVSSDAFNGELRRMAESDSLTGLPNRRRLLERGEDEVRRARRYGRPLAVLVLDIDHFKRINDERGHAAGDVALKETAARCRAVLRDIDMFARLGGEEFVAVLPETGFDDAAAAAERLRLAMADPLRSGSFNLRLTASLGVAVLRENETFAAVLARADAAMYRAKETGRDRVCLAAAA